MKIYYYQGQHPNFGDELNWWMWPKILPGFFDDNEDVLFLGIGSILGVPHNQAAKKVVFGSAYVPEYHGVAPDVHGADWEIRFVRGPRTARLLNLPPDMAVGDSGILLRTVVDLQRKAPEVVSFIPHWESMERGNWEKVCRLAGITLIDPRRPVEEVIAALLRSKLVLAEAMHGAIVADAFRIPWVPLLPLHPQHREKWLDWAEGMKIELNPQYLWPSNVQEIKSTLEYHHPRRSEFVASLPFTGLIDKTLPHLAAHKLQRLSRVEPSLSADSEIDRVTEIMLGKVRDLQRDYAA